MNALRVAWLAALASMLSAQSAGVSNLIAAQRRQIESSDFRAIGHLVSVEAGGTRISYPITIEGHWFPGVLRLLVNLGQPSSTHRDAREHILLEMRPDGANSIRVADPGDSAPRVLPVEKWNDHPLGPGFTYEDFLPEQYYWPGQVSEGTQKIGARNCDVVMSTPGAADRTGIAQMKTWIDPTINFPVYTEKTVKGTGAVKQFTAYGIRHEEGVWSAHQIEVKIRGQAGSTLLIIDRGTVKAHLTAADFSPGRLTHF